MTTTTTTSHTTTVREGREAAHWTCTCGERGQSFKIAHLSTVRLSAVYHERNNNG